MTKFFPAVAGAAAAVLMSATVTLAHDGHKAPTEHKGVSVFGKDALELGAQIPAMEGFQVRVRQVKVEPGGIVANHDHSTRPGAYYVISGDGVTEHRGNEKFNVPAGTAVLESQDVDHWISNDGGEAHFFVFDIVPVEN
ncbi:cupin domain-containing protein [Epibacterium sp. SM1979]|uniref:Cupin domain-containing protein n=1 Tax=Tritonibacter litoralis TaxID=2662264 RepID=A0A843YD40_9RHOB|nr:cupin domain-containing protein [Tritonibacter litoralis]MQQ08936.1 cupin domain-containing protein [Tritonibacter litoralis]